MKLTTILLLLFSLNLLIAQENPNPLPRHLTTYEKKIMELGLYQPPLKQSRNNTEPPDFSTRTIGEWEELQSIVVTWDAFYSVLREIVRYSKDEVEVINVCQDSAAIKEYLTENGIDMENLTFIQAPFNTVWVRDYGPNPVYQNDVDSLLFIDWIYNRPRPSDDTIPDVISEYIGAPQYATTKEPHDLVHTGGNFMSDGLGMGLSSQLILEENDESNPFGTSNHSEEDIDEIMSDFMGIEEYPKMQSLLYDGINHIDMHMKLLDEQTLLVGEFPEGVADGPRIEENIQFLRDNFKTYWGTDLKIERILQPPCGNGLYPPQCSNPYEYRTYTNALFVNKTILVPIYNTVTDEEALVRWQELMPGYKIRGIDCRQIINWGGAIHCVTKEIGVHDPLWIAHRGLDDLLAENNTNDYQIEAKIKHRSGITSANLYWTTDLSLGYQSIPMQLADEDFDIWNASIPIQVEGGQIYYYIQATASSGKSIVRPLPAPEGYFAFTVESPMTDVHDIQDDGIRNIRLFPNPAKGQSMVQIESDHALQLEISITGILGEKLALVFDGKISVGKNEIALQTDQLASGTYFIQLKTKDSVQIKKLIVQ
ncbi:MAG: agmatine deiminase family protein [Bacteroidota bacterium]